MNRSLIVLSAVAFLEDLSKTDFDQYKCKL